MVSCDPRVLLVVIATDTGMIGASNSRPISLNTEALAFLIFIYNSLLKAARVVCISSVIICARLSVPNSMQEIGTDTLFRTA